MQRIKDTIIELVNSEERLPSAKFSDFLAQKLNHSYGHISKLFSDVTYTSIENFIILQKIERAKQLIIAGELTLTEIAWQLNYSSVQHLSNQFKKNDRNHAHCIPTDYKNETKSKLNFLQPFNIFILFQLGFK